MWSEGRSTFTRRLVAARKIRLSGRFNERSASPRENGTVFNGSTYYKLLQSGRHRRDLCDRTEYSDA
jgi:hypothetical protein